MKIFGKLLAGLTSLLAICVLPACGGTENPPRETVVMSATILEADEGGVLLVAPNDENGLCTSTGQACSTSIKQENLFDAEGKNLDPGELFAGQTIEITYDGVIMESYPGQIRSDKIVVTGQQAEDWVNPITQDEFFTNPPVDDDPLSMIPRLQVEYRTDLVASCTNAPRGTCSWYENGEGVCADSPHPLQWEESRVPFIRHTPGFDKLTLIFSREGAEVSVRRWGWADFGDISVDGNAVDVPVKDNVLTLPKDQNAYLFEVHAVWEEGDASYVFAVCGEDEKSASEDEGESSLCHLPPVEESEITLSVEQDSFSLSRDEEITYTVSNRTGKECEIQLIPLLERQNGSDWEKIPLGTGFCGMPDPLPESRSGSVSFTWYDNLEPGRYRLSFHVEDGEEEYQPSAEFDLTD